MTIAINLNDAQVFITAPQSSAFKKAPRKRSRSSIKRVNFVPYVTAYEDKTTEFIVEDRWYSHEDYKAFKQVLQRDIASFRKFYSMSERVLEQVMKACQTACDRYDTYSSTDFSELLPHGLESLLQKSIQSTPYAIGLHKFCTQYLVHDRKVRRCDIVAAVLRTQSHLWISMGSNMVTAGECQKLSRPSRLFSQIIAHVAAKAA